MKKGSKNSLKNLEKCILFAHCMHFAFFESEEGNSFLSDRHLLSKNNF